MTKEELLVRKKEIKSKMWEIEDILKDKTFVSSVDFASMYPSVIRLLNASIENLVGFLDNDPIAYRRLGKSKTVKEAVQKSKDLTKTTLKDSRYVNFVGKNEDKVSLRRDIYKGKFDDCEIDEMCETPFERYFLANMFGDETQMFKFQDKEYTAHELQTYLKEKNYSISGSGAIYKRYIEEKGDANEHKQGLIPSYLSYLFKERKKVKKKMAGFYRHKILLQKFEMAALEDGLWKED